MVSMMKDFKNILKEVKNNSNDFKWVARPIEFTKSFKQSRPTISPYQLKQIVINNEQLYKILEEICKKDSARHFHKKLVAEILMEIGYDYDLSVIRWLGYILVKILRRSLSGLHVNEEELLRIKSDMGDSPVIFVPTHRSYGDFILMAFVCFYYEISIPCVAAGMDFYNMWVMSKILRKSKAFYMRRKFSDDPIYRNIFKEYMKALITYEDSPVEFFIEGTRSRSGKSLMPKFGLLTMLTSAYLSGDIPDIKVIPVNISYDRVLEEILFAHELLGIPKPKESTKGLMKALKKMNGNYGNVFINFGEPFSMRSFFHEESDLRYQSNESEASTIKEMAFKIIEMQQNLQVFGCFNLLALIIYNNKINTGSHFIDFQDAVQKFKWLLDLFKLFNANVCLEGSIEDEIKESINVHTSLVELSDDNFIYLKLNNKLTYSGGDVYMEELPFMMLQIYVNPSINLFIRSSIIITILKNNFMKNELSEEILFENYKYLRLFLRHEFVLNDSDNKGFSNSISKLSDLSIIEVKQCNIQLNKCCNTVQFLYNLIHPFLLGIHLVCSFLREFQNEIIKKKQTDIVKMVQAYVKEKIMNGEVIHYYCLSIDMITNAFHSLSNMGIIYYYDVKNEYLVDQQSLNHAYNYLGSLIAEGTHNSDQENYKQKKKYITAKL